MMTCVQQSFSCLNQSPSLTLLLKLLFESEPFIGTAPHRWDQPCIVSRAPGRMDVMGGIADYSGALVLQMPIAEACHVALQRQPTQGGSRPTVAIVSFHADSSHHSPSFMAPLSDIFPGGQPMGYESARAYFKASLSRLASGGWG